MSKHSKRLLVCTCIAAACAFGLCLRPRSASAYFETNLTGRITTPANSGCIQFSSNLSHSDAQHTMSGVASAAAAGPGFSNVPVSPLARNGVQCQTASGSTGIAGRVEFALLKFISAGSRRDNYSYCRIVTTDYQSLSSMLNVVHDFGPAPCGDGSYALVACLLDATAILTQPSKTGTFSATDMIRDCNVSPNWHVLGSTIPGSPVRL